MQEVIISLMAGSLTVCLFMGSYSIGVTIGVGVFGWNSEQGEKEGRVAGQISLLSGTLFTLLYLAM